MTFCQVLADGKVQADTASEDSATFLEQRLALNKFFESMCFKPDVYWNPPFSRRSSRMVATILQLSLR